MVDITYPAFLHGQSYVTFSRARTESQIYAVCRADGHFTSLTYSRMLEDPVHCPTSEKCAGYPPRADGENQSSDSDRDDPFDGTGADWFADSLSASVNLRNTKRSNE